MKKILFLSFLLNIIFGLGLCYAIHKLGGIKYILFKMQNRGTTGVYEHRKSVFEILPQQKNPIVFLGDSITEACEWAELFGDSTIQNRGIAGDMTDGVLRRLPVILDSQPRQIFLMIGVNDLIMRSVDEIVNNYETILQQIQQQSPATKVYVQSVLPVNNDLRQTKIKNADILKINEGIQALANQYSYNYINLHQKMSDSKDNLDAQYSSDGIHLNGKAYLVWKDVTNNFVTSNE